MGFQFASNTFLASRGGADFKLRHSGLKSTPFSAILCLRPSRATPCRQAKRATASCGRLARSLPAAAGATTTVAADRTVRMAISSMSWIYSAVPVGALMAAVRAGGVHSRFRHRLARHWRLANHLHLIRPGPVVLAPRVIRIPRASPDHAANGQSHHDDHYC